MKSITTFCILLLCIFNGYSQIPFGNIEKKEKIKEAIRPAPYDSSKNMEYQKNLIDYKQYIGLQLFLPQITNPTIAKFTGKDINFLYSIKPVKIKAEKTVLVREKNENGEWVEKIAAFRTKNSDNQWVEFKYVLTSVYKPFSLLFRYS